MFIPYSALLQGDLLRITQLFPTTFTKALANYQSLPEGDADVCASFLKACLHLNPANRASAAELLQHPWLEGAWEC